MTDLNMLHDGGKEIEREQFQRLKILSIIEAITLVVLVCVAVPLKHVYGWPIGSKVMGPLHGIAFLAYIWTALQTVSGGGWRAKEIVRLFGVAFVPFAGFFNISWLRKKTHALGRERAS